MMHHSILHGTFNLKGTTIYFPCNKSILALELVASTSLLDGDRQPDSEVLLGASFYHQTIGHMACKKGWGPRGERTFP